MTEAWKKEQGKIKKPGPFSVAAIGDTLTLPFVDDFSQGKVFPEESLWESSGAFVNTTMAYHPVTIGVATFDGGSRTGYPYNMVAPLTWGGGDTLLSKSIRMDSTAGNVLTPDSNVFISFYYQPQGRGNAPETEDSLVLEFFRSDSLWIHGWSSPGYEPGPDTLRFRLAIVQVTDPLCFFSGFRFRFRNYATQGGFLDIWNLDFVRLDKNRNASDTLFNDVAFVSMSSSLLNDYQQVPWTHFYPNQAALKANTFYNSIVNLDNSLKNLHYAYEIFQHPGAGTPIYSHPDLPDNIDPVSFAVYTPHVQPDFSFSFPAVSGDSVAFTLVNALNTTPDFNRTNDTIIKTQLFYNYYARDDGSAENSYGINELGGKIAYKFSPFMSDTLQGVFMYFVRTLEDVSQRTFKMTVWDASGADGKPGNILYQAPEVTPMYRDWPNAFYYYDFPVPLFIDILQNPDVYIGWEQNTEDLLNIGLDSNKNAKESMYFNTTGIWYQSIINGSWMMRPAFGKPIPDGINSGTLTIPENSLHKTWSVFPNPTQEYISIDWKNEKPEQWTVEILNLIGTRLISCIGSKEMISLGGLPMGIYILSASNSISGENRNLKIILTR